MKISIRRHFNRKYVIKFFDKDYKDDEHYRGSYISKYRSYHNWSCDADHILRALVFTMTEKEIKQLVDNINNSWVIDFPSSPEPCSYIEI